MGPTEDDWTEIIGTFHIIEGHMAHETRDIQQIWNHVTNILCFQI